MISADRPFGILLYPYFEKAYEAVVGSPASSFKFLSEDTPFSTDKQTYGACVTYLFIVLSFKYLMRNQKPFSLTLLFRIHNLILTVVSIALFLLISEQFIPLILNQGFFYSVCSKHVWNQKIELLFYLNFLSKFMELADTMFMIARKKAFGKFFFDSKLTL